MTTTAAPREVSDVATRFEERMGYRRTMLWLAADWLRRLAGEPDLPIPEWELRAASVTIAGVADELCGRVVEDVYAMHGSVEPAQADAAAAQLAALAEHLEGLAATLTRHAMGPMNQHSLPATDALWGVVNILEDIAERRVLEGDIDEILRPPEAV